MKTCTRCGSEKPKDKFHKDKNRADGKYPQCKSCALYLAQVRRDSVSGGKTAEHRAKMEEELKLLERGRKTCTGCETVLSLNEFHSAKGKRGGKNSQCRSCASAAKKLDHQKHQDKRLAYLKRYREENPEKVSDGKKRCYERNREHYMKKAAEWAKANPERLLEYKSQWYRDNRDRLNSKLRQRHREDPEFRSRCAMRGVLHKFLDRSSGKKSGRTHEVLKYSYADFKHHIERQFVKGMHWGNYGRNGWVIDHIIPVAEYIRNGETDPAIVNCLTNLRPMWAKDNISKSDKITHLL